MSTETLAAAVLSSLSDGVLVIGGDGQILAFNAAAEAILGIPSSSAIGSGFAHLFLQKDGRGAFSDAVLAAAYEPGVTHVTTVPYATGSQERRLAIKTTRLQGAAGIAVVFSDVTEVTRLSDELNAKHAELQKAFLKVEEQNRELRTASRKVHLVGGAASVFAVLLVASAGFFAFARGRAALLSSRPSSGPAQPAGHALVLEPRLLTETISLAGTLRPLNIVNVTSPFAGKVAERLVQYGQAVEKGDPLVRMDTSDVAQRFREALANSTKARQAYQLLCDWEKSPDVSRARRSHLKARMTLEAQRQSEIETEALYQKGIVSKSERDNAVTQRRGAEMDMQAAEEELQATLEKGSASAIRMARDELEGAERHQADLERQLQTALIRSPVSGTVFAPVPAGGAGKTEKLVEKGVSFSEAEGLLAIGNMQGVSISVDVDELEVLKVQEGQPAEVTGEAFADSTLSGRVSSVSGMADERRGLAGQGEPGFEVVIVVEQLSPEQRRKVRPGMSARIDIAVAKRDGVLVVPFDAVQLQGSGRFVKVRDRTSRKLEDVKVETGVTLVDGVEVISGLSAGDEVVW